MISRRSLRAVSKNRQVENNGEVFFCLGNFNLCRGIATLLCEISLRGKLSGLHDCWQRFYADASVKRKKYRRTKSLSKPRPTPIESYINQFQLLAWLINSFSGEMRSLCVLNGLEPSHSFPQMQFFSLARPDKYLPTHFLCGAVLQEHGVSPFVRKNPTL